MFGFKWPTKNVTETKRATEPTPVQHDTPTPAAKPFDGWASGLASAGGILEAFAKQALAYDGAKPERELGETPEAHAKRVAKYDETLQGPDRGVRGTGRAVGAEYRSGDDDAGTASSTSLRASGSGVDAAHSWSKRHTDHEQTRGVGAHLESGKFAASYQEGKVTERDAEGNVKAGSLAGVALGQNGLAMRSDQTVDGTERSSGFGLGPDGVQVDFGKKKDGVSHGASAMVTADGVGGSVKKSTEGGTHYGASAMIGEDMFSVGVTGGYGNLKLGASLTVVDDKELASLDEDGTSLVSQFLGAPTAAFGLLDATQVAGSAGISNGWLGVGVSGKVSSSSAVQVHTTVDALAGRLGANPDLRDKIAGKVDPMGVLGFDASTLDAKGLAALAKSDERAYRELMSAAMSGRVDDVERLDQLGDLAVGEAFTMRSGEGWGVTGSVTVGLTLSLGVEGQEAEQVTIAKTGDDAYTVHMAAMDAETVKASVGIGDALSVSASDRESKTSEVELVMTGDQLATFKETGILPGANGLADEGALQAYRDAKADIDRMGGPDSPLAHSAVQRLRDATGRINRNVLTGDGELTELEGAQYTRRRHSRSEEDKGELGLLGWSWAWGSTHSTFDEQYRKGESSEWARGTKHHEDNWFSPDETTSAVLNPRNAHLVNDEGEQAEIEMAFFSKQGLNKRQRTLLQSAGGLRGETDAMQQAFVDGKADGETSRVQLAWTAGHMEKFREAALTGNADAFGSVTAGLDDGMQAMLPGSGMHEKMQAAMYNEIAGTVADDVYDEWMDKGWGGFNKRQQKLASTDTVEEFETLSTAEQSLLITTYAIDAIENGGDPWQAATFAMAGKDADTRNKHLRKLFHVIERGKEDTHAVVDFVDHLRDRQKSGYVDAKLTKELLDTLRVENVDGRVDRRAGLMRGLGDAGTDLAANGLLTDSEDLIDADERWEILPQIRDLQRQRADKTVDWLTATRKAGGPEAVERVLRAAEKQKKGSVLRIMATVKRVDPRRAAILQDMVGETDLPKETLRAMVNAMPWWSRDEDAA